MSHRIAALVSPGCHPASGRPRAAALDARAVGLALTLSPQPDIFYAGPGDDALFREYLGLGIPVLHHVAVEGDCDPVPALAEALGAGGYSAVLAGIRAEQGPGTGQLPYVLADRLGAVLVPNIVALDLDPSGASADIIQALPRGRRRRLSVNTPVVATVGAAAPPPPAFAYGPARRGQVRPLPGIAAPATMPDGVEERPASPRPKRLFSTPIQGDARTRLRAAYQRKTGEGRLIVDPSPEEAAEAILDYLIRERIVTIADRPEELQQR